MTAALTPLPPADPAEPPITEAEAAAIMAKLKINADPAALVLHKQLGQYLIAQDVGACQIARNFDSEAQIAHAIEVSRELSQSADPEIRIRGTQTLLLALKTRLALAEQAIKLAAASRGKTRAANRPPVFYGPVTMLTQSPPIPV